MQETNIHPGRSDGYLYLNPNSFPTVRAFPNLNQNVSLGKSFFFTERLHLDFRAEAFDLLNRVVFGSPGNNINSATFGVVSSQANSPRQMQMALKLYW